MTVLIKISQLGKSCLRHQNVSRHLLGTVFLMRFAWKYERRGQLGKTPKWKSKVYNVCSTRHDSRKSFVGFKKFGIIFLHDDEATCNENFSLN